MDNYLDNLNKLHIREVEKGVRCLGKLNIYDRNCFEDIYKDIVVNIGKREKCKKNMERGVSLPQLCFLIYGNQDIGKSSLWYDLAFRFSREYVFFGYDIIVFSEEGKNEEQPCFVRFGGSTNCKYTFYYSNDIPERREDHPTIIISDNTQIREDEFSNDEVVIMISSPDTEKYKIFRNKRAPIQYYILTFNNEELEILCSILRKKDKVAEDFIYAAREYGITKAKHQDVGFTMDSKIPMEICYNYIPKKYNEDLFIYNTDKYNVIPDSIKFKSTQAKISLLLQEYSKSDENNSIYKDMIRVFLYKKDPIVFEMLMHWILKLKVRVFVDWRNIFCTSKLKGLDSFGSTEHIENCSFVESYTDFSLIHIFPGVDGITVKYDAISGLQMTIAEGHDTKANMIYHMYLDMIVGDLKKKLKEGVNIDYFSIVLYNFGYTTKASIDRIRQSYDQNELVLLEINESSYRGIDVEENKKNYENYYEKIFKIKEESFLVTHLKETAMINYLSSINKRIRESYEKDDIARRRLIHDLDDYIIDRKYETAKKEKRNEEFEKDIIKEIIINVQQRKNLTPERRFKELINTNNLSILKEILDILREINYKEVIDIINEKYADLVNKAREEIKKGYMKEIEYMKNYIEKNMNEELKCIIGDIRSKNNKKIIDNVIIELNEKYLYESDVEIIRTELESKYVISLENIKNEINNQCYIIDKTKNRLIEENKRKGTNFTLKQLTRELHKEESDFINKLSKTKGTDVVECLTQSYYYEMEILMKMYKDMNLESENIKLSADHSDYIKHVVKRLKRRISDLSIEVVEMTLRKMLKGKITLEEEVIDEKKTTKEICYNIKTNENIERITLDIIQEYREQSNKIIDKVIAELQKQENLDKMISYEDMYETLNIDNSADKKNNDILQYFIENKSEEILKIIKQHYSKGDEMAKKIKQKINLSIFEVMINELYLCNPPFPIVFISYQNKSVSSKSSDSSAYFECYDKFIAPMREEMLNIYKWYSIEKDEKKTIIAKRSKRLRFYTHNIDYTLFFEHVKEDETEVKFIFSDPDKGDKDVSDKRIRTFDEKNCEVIEEYKGKNTSTMTDLNKEYEEAIKCLAQSSIVLFLRLLHSSYPNSQSISSLSSILSSSISQNPILESPQTIPTPPISLEHIRTRSSI